MKKRFGIFCVIGCMLLSACSSKSRSDSAMAPEAGYDMKQSMASNGMSYGGELYDGELAGGAETPYNKESAVSAVTEEKLIRTVSLRLQTKEFDEVLSYLEERLLLLGGYIENSRIEGNSLEYTGYRSAVLTVRIPKADADEFIRGVGEKAVIVSKSENVENVTLQYTDSESRLKALRIEQERFLELLQKAEDIETILVLENHLTDLRYQIEKYESQLRFWDNRVDYTSISITLSEVKRITPVEEKPTLFTRMKQGFEQTCYEIAEGAGNFLVWFVSNVLYLAIWGVFLFAAGKIVFHILKKRKKKALMQYGNHAQPEKEPENGEKDGRVDSEK